MSSNYLVRLSWWRYLPIRAAGLDPVLALRGSGGGHR
ncbi:MAG: hypothetical protein ACJAWL_001505 [Motiliproteus sp.]|jgi:hypothetical protein